MAQMFQDWVTQLEIVVAMPVNWNTANRNGIWNTPKLLITAKVTGPTPKTDSGPRNRPRGVPIAKTMVSSRVLVGMMAPRLSLKKTASQLAAAVKMPWKNRKPIRGAASMMPSYRVRLMVSPRPLKLLP